MTQSARRAALIVASIVLATVSVGVVRAGASESRRAGACSDTAGVTVIVDFGDLPGGVQTGCATAPVGSGFEALTKAGFSITNVAGSAFLCRIDGEPAADPCNRIPSASRYWGYWHAARGEGWTYSSSGASRQPPPGSVEGWSFGSGAEPGLAPPGPITTTTTAPTTTTTTSTTTTANPVPTTATAGAGGGGVTEGTTPPTTGAPVDPGATSTTATTASAVVVADPVRDEQAAGGATGDAVGRDGGAGRAGSPAGVLAAGLAVMALGGGAWRTARRRARDREAGA